MVLSGALPLWLSEEQSWFALQQILYVHWCLCRSPSHLLWLLTRDLYFILHSSLFYKREAVDTWILLFPANALYSSVFCLFLCLRSGLFLRPPDGITIESQQGEAANLTMRMLYKQLCLLFIHFEWKFEWLHSRAESLDGYWAIFALFLPFASRTFNQIERTKLT